MVKKTFLIIFALLLFISFTSAAWFDSDWNYKREIKVKENSATNLINYSTLIYVNYSKDTGSHAQVDFDDLRFVNADEDTELGYWIENKTDSNFAWVWVKVPTLTASINNTIYMYYGNDAVSSKSNISKSFPESEWSTNLAQGKTANAQQYDSGSPPSKAVDGSTSTQWWGGSSSGGMDNWFNINLANKYLIMKVGNYFGYTNHNEGVRNWGFGTSGSITQDFGMPQYTASQQAYQYKNYTEMNVSFSQRIGQYVQVWTDNIAGGGYGTSMSEWVVYGVLRASVEPTYTIGEEKINGQAPEVTLNSPSNYAVLETTSIELNATVTDDIFVENVSLYIDGSLNQTNSSHVNGTYIFNIDIGEGTYGWKIVACNNQSLCTNSSINYFLVDLYDPVVTIDFPVDAGEYNYNITTLNSTASDTHLESCWYSIDDFVTNTTFTCNTDVTFNKINITYDTSNFTGWISSPAGMPITTCGSYPMFGGYNQFGQNAYAQTTLNLPAGIYNISWYYYAVDHWDGESGRVSINGTPVWTKSFTPSGNSICGGPTGESYNVLNNTYYYEYNHSGGEFTLKFDSTLNQAASDESWGFNNVQVVSEGIYFGSNEGFNTWSVNEGFNTWSVCANDSASHETCDSTTFEVDTTEPFVNITYPLNGAYYDTQLTSLNYDATDTNLYQCWYSTDFGLTNSTPGTCTGSFSVNSVEGQNNWTVYAIDSFGNENSSSVTFYQDTIMPEIEIIQPLNQTYATTSLEYKIKVNEPAESCLLTLDDFVTNTTMNKVNSTYFNYTNSSISSGDYNVKFACTDLAGNLGYNSSEFTVQTVSTTLNSPEDDYIYYDFSPITFNATGETVEGYIANMSLWTNVSGTWEVYNTTEYTIGLNITSGNITLGGDLVYDYIYVGPSATIYINQTIGYLNLTSKGPVEIYGTIDGNGRGYAGGPGGTTSSSGTHHYTGSTGLGPGGGIGGGWTRDISYYVGNGGGGGGAVLSGGTGGRYNTYGQLGVGGTAYMTSPQSYIGSGGGASGHTDQCLAYKTNTAGGNGGSGLMIKATNMTIGSTSKLLVNGNNGGSVGWGGSSCEGADGGSGGGSAGSIVLEASILNINGNLSAIGGNGGSGSVYSTSYTAHGGGGGAGGLIVFKYETLSNSSLITSVVGGAGGVGVGHSTYRRNGAAGGTGSISLAQISNLEIPVDTKDTLWILNLTNDIVWNVETCNSEGSCEFADSNFSVYRDKTEPVVEIIYPENITYTISPDSFNFSVDDIGSNIDTCIYNYNGTNITLLSCYSEDFPYFNHTYSDTTQLKNFTTTDFVKLKEFVVDKYLWNSSIQLASSSTAYNKEVNQVIIYKNGTTLNQTNITNSTSYITFDFINPNILEEVDKVEIWAREVSTAGDGYVKDFKVNYFDYQPLSIVSEEGYNTLKMYINDTVSNNGSTEVTYFVDTIQPIVNIDFPLNNSRYNETSKVFSFNYTVIDTNPNICWYSIDYGVTNSSNYTSGEHFNIQGVFGENHWEVYCVDILENFGMNETTFYIYNMSFSIDDLIIEVGANTTINAGINLWNVSLDIPHSQYGINYLTNLSNLTLNLMIDYFERFNFFDDATEVNITNDTISNETTIIEMHKYDYVESISFNLFGHSISDIFIYNPFDNSILKTIKGTLINNTLYLSNFFNPANLSNAYTNTTELAFDNIGYKYIYVPISDLAELVNLSIDFTAEEYGFTFKEDYINSTDEVLTNATVFLGNVMPATTNLRNEIFDTFNTSLNRTYWFLTPDYSEVNTGDELDQIISNSVGGGRARLYSELEEDLDEYKSDSATLNNYLYINDTSYFNLWSNEDTQIKINYTIYGQEDKTCDENRGYATLTLGGVELWRSIEMEDICDDSFTAYSNGLVFNITRDYALERIWLNITGVEQTGPVDTGSCGNLYVIRNWTNGSQTLDFQNCPDQTGPIPVSYIFGGFGNLDDQLKFRTYLRGWAKRDVIDYCHGNGRFYDSGEVITCAFATTSEQCAYLDQIIPVMGGTGVCAWWTDQSVWQGTDKAYVDLNILEINRTVGDPANSTYVSKSVFDSGIDLTNLIAYYFGKGTINTQISSDNGLHFQDILPEGTPMPIFYPGKNVKWKANFFAEDSTASNLQIITNINISSVKGYPSNVTFDIGNTGTIDQYFNGTLNGNYNFSLSNINLTNYLLTAPNPFSKYIPIKVYTQTPGYLNFTGLNVSYNLGRTYLNSDNVRDYLSLGNGTIPLTIGANYSGNNLTLKDLEIRYLGGNYTLPITAHSDDYIMNRTINVTYYFTQWDYNWIPDGVEWVYFPPKTPTSKGVMPYGQTISIPLMNVTNLGYGSDNATLSVYLNETLSCVNTILSFSNNKSAGFVLNNSWTEIANMTYLDTKNIWLFADYDCTYNNYYLYNPYFTFRFCKDGALCSEEAF